MSNIIFWKPKPYAPETDLIITKPSILSIATNQEGNPIMDSETGLFVLKIQELK